MSLDGTITSSILLTAAVAWSATITFYCSLEWLQQNTKLYGSLIYRAPRKQRSAITATLTLVFPYCASAGLCKRSTERLDTSDLVCRRHLTMRIAISSGSVSQFEETLISFWLNVFETWKSGNSLVRHMANLFYGCLLFGLWPGCLSVFLAKRKSGWGICGSSWLWFVFWLSLICLITLSQVSMYHRFWERLWELLILIRTESESVVGHTRGQKRWKSSSISRLVQNHWRIWDKFRGVIVFLAEAVVCILLVLDVHHTNTKDDGCYCPSCGHWHCQLASRSICRLLFLPVFYFGFCCFLALFVRESNWIS